MDEQEDNYMSFPVFPTLDNDEPAEDTVSNSTSTLRPRFYPSEEEMLLWTPTQSLKSPLSVEDFFVIPPLKVEPFRLDEERRDESENGENLPPPLELPALPLLVPVEVKVTKECPTPLRIKLQPTHRRARTFTSMAA